MHPLARTEANDPAARTGLTKSFHGTVRVEKQDIRNAKDSGHLGPNVFGNPIMINTRQLEKILRLGVLCDLGANTAFVIRFFEIRHFQRI
jgi:hypothetical protein